MKVVKRNGDLVEFDRSKIAESIRTASDEVDNPKKRLSKETIQMIVSRLYERIRKRVCDTSSAEIEDMVSIELMKERAYEVANVYIKNSIRKLLLKASQNKTGNADDTRSILGEIGYGESILFEAPSYDNAIVGVTNDGNVVYAYDLMVDSLVNITDMSFEDACEFIDKNTLCCSARLDNLKPIVIYKIRGDY